MISIQLLFDCELDMAMKTTLLFTTLYILYISIKINAFNVDTRRFPELFDRSLGRFQRSMEKPGTLCSRFMRFRFMRFSIYAVLGIGPYFCFTRQYSHIMRFLVKIIVHKILVIFILHLCYSCITRFFSGNKKRVNGELSVLMILFSL